MRSGKILVVLGLLMVAYTLSALLFGLPILSDFMPAEEPSGYEGKFYKIVASTEPSYAEWYEIGIGLSLILLGCVLVVWRKKLEKNSNA